jgi:alanine racemase
VPRQTFANINLAAVLHNYHQAQQAAPHSKTMAVIKADAYGHGMLAIAQYLQQVADGFAVAFIDEAITLREHGITQPILVLEGAHQPVDLTLALEHDLWMVVHQPEQVIWLLSALAAGQPIPTLWFKVDTGLHRLGLTVAQLDYALASLPEKTLENAVLMGHFACADEPKNGFNGLQMERLTQVASTYQLPISMANSPAIAADPMSHGLWNRLGIALYGAEPMNQTSQHTCTLSLQPVMQLSAAIIGLRHIKQGEGVGYGQTWHAPRDCVIATLAIGYGDGYPRHAPTGTPAWLHGQTIPLVGRVSMDMITFDVTDVVEPLAIGDNVELWGQHLSVTEVAKHVQTINYELLTRISHRVTKKYHYN